MVMHYSTITPEKINKIKAAGIRTGDWTVDDPNVMKSFIKDGY
jgi:anti-sigma28 factor (negative regulator of flagellin synthesis)